MSWKTLFCSSSYRIGPVEVESALAEHPAVVESAVVSSPDPIRGEVIIPPRTPPPEQAARPKSLHILPGSGYPRV